MKAYVFTVSVGVAESCTIALVANNIQEAEDRLCSRFYGNHEVLLNNPTVYPMHPVKIERWVNNKKEEFDANAVLCAGYLCYEHNGTTFAQRCKVKEIAWADNTLAKVCCLIYQEDSHEVTFMSCEYCGKRGKVQTDKHVVCQSCLDEAEEDAKQYAIDWGIVS